jgi:hypothetical protein
MRYRSLRSAIKNVRSNTAFRQRACQFPGSPSRRLRRRHWIRRVNKDRNALCPADRGRDSDRYTGCCTGRNLKKLPPIEVRVHDLLPTALLWLW